MEEYVQAAIGAGLKELVFLEHMEACIVSGNRTWLTESDFEAYEQEGKRLRDIYGNKISIGLGVECGYNPTGLRELRELLAARSWDQIGLSCHFLWLADENSHLNLFSRREKNLALARRYHPQELLTRYFDLLLEGVELLPVTKVCHLDGALRWLPELQCTAEHYNQIDALLAAMLAKRVGLEINTSGIPIRGEQFPATPILNRARELGIHLILGSDAHRPAEVARHFELFS
jgi:histidinol-phosphatase (PHP family)